MTTPAIQVQGISKLYRLEHAAPGSKNFREALTDLAKAPMRRFRRLSGIDKGLEDFWALKDVSFDVQPGDVVGIVGRNGAGKSTLLKILSRIVEPTAGQVRMRGRVASLLEVGTGFHPELSGRENIYLNGSILGMKRREIDARFDEIVAFADVEKFLDTPVKRYSSGMYVRLAFAVAAHLEPEILVVDEVLAVGDAEFQKRCLGKMKQIATSGGRTVLFVSHNMSAVRTLCTRGVLLQRGEVEAVGTADEIVETYMAPAAADLPSGVTFPSGHGAMQMRQVDVMADGVPSAAVSMGAALSLRIRYGSTSAFRAPKIGVVITSSEGDRVLATNNRFQPGGTFEQAQHGGELLCELGDVPLMPGRYAVSLWLGDEAGDHHVAQDALHFDVLERDLWGFGQLPPRAANMWWPTKFSVSPT